MFPSSERCHAGGPRQQTLAGEAAFAGVGLHTGAQVRCRVRPAPSDHGLVLLSRGACIPVSIDSVVDSTRCSALGAGNVHVATVEHLLAALAGLRIDNALIEVDGPELPALDGSALPFAEGLLAAGICEQDAPARIIRLRSLTWISEGDRHVVAIPAEGLTVVALVDYGRPLAGRQAFAFAFDTAPKPAEAILAHAGAAVGSDWDFHLPEPAEFLLPGDEFGTPLAFIEELAPARTFCFEDWIAALRAAGLGGGGSIDNTLVLSDRGTSTPLRFPNELARHKTLDLLGDLSLLGARLSATVVAVKAGHHLHLAAAQQIRKAVYEY
jgi:UDP-3-O-acyl-N-acetylglucosamine deacetylase